MTGPTIGPADPAGCRTIGSPGPTDCRRRPSITALASTLALALALAACGGSSSGAADRSTPPVADSTATGSTTTIAATTTTSRPTGRAVVSAGCDRPDRDTGSATPRVEHMRVGRVDRTFTVAVPAATAHQDRVGPYPLLLQFHGFASSAALIDADTGLSRRGTAAGFVVVTPDALGSPTQFNMFGAAGQADDFGFVAALVPHVEGELCIDTRRVFAAGHSNGSAFTGFLPCRVPHTFAAIAMASATIPPVCPKTERPSIYATAGTADPQVPARGGTVGGSTTQIPPAEQSIAAWRKALGCRATPSVSHPFVGVTEEQAVGCRSHRQVVYDEVDGGTHPWPGGLAAKADPGESTAGKQYDATGRILRFFASVPSR